MKKPNRPQSQQPQDNDLSLPPELESQLNSLFSDQAVQDQSQTQELDHQIDQAADLHFQAMQNARLRITAYQKVQRFALKLAPLAALIALSVVFWPNQDHPSNHSNELSPHISDVSQRGDINADGAVDIVDALALSHQLKQNKLSPIADLNADGKINQLDLNWLTTKIVKLNSAAGGSQ